MTESIAGTIWWRMRGSGKSGRRTRGDGVLESRPHINFFDLNQIRSNNYGVPLVCGGPSRFSIEPVLPPAELLYIWRSTWLCASPLQRLHECPAFDITVVDTR